MRNAKIYGLVDPRTRELRYVGKTVRKLTVRKRQHIKGALKPSKNSFDRHRPHKDYWLLKLLRAKLEPEIILLELVPEVAWQEAEQFWIEYFNFLGANLTNATDGGDGCGGWNRGQKMDPVWRKKLSEARKKFFNAGGKAWNDGVPPTDETKEKLRQANLGKTYSAETNLAKGKGWKGKKRGPMPAAQRAKVSANKKGKKLHMTAAQIQARNAKAWESRRRNGTDKHSEETKKLISLKKMGQRMATKIELPRPEV